MKCKYCNKEFSKNVWKIHTPICKKMATIDADEVIEEHIVINMDNPDMYKEMKMNELRKEAKKQGLDMGKNPTKAALIEALETSKWG